MSTSNFIPIGGAGGGASDSNVLFKPVAADWGSLVTAPTGSYTSATVQDLAGTIVPTMRFSVTGFVDSTSSSTAAWELTGFQLPSRFVVRYQMANVTETAVGGLYLRGWGLADPSQISAAHTVGLAVPTVATYQFGSISVRESSSGPGVWAAETPYMPYFGTLSEQVIDVVAEVATLNASNVTVNGPEVIIRATFTASTNQTGGYESGDLMETADKDNVAQAVEVVNRVSSATVVAQNPGGSASWAGHNILRWCMLPICYTTSYDATVDIAGMQFEKHPADL